MKLGKVVKVMFIMAIVAVTVAPYDLKVFAETPLKASAKCNHTIVLSESLLNSASSLVDGLGSLLRTLSNGQLNTTAYIDVRDGYIHVKAILYVGDQKIDTRVNIMGKVANGNIEIWVYSAFLNGERIPQFLVDAAWLLTWVGKGFVDILLDIAVQLLGDQVVQQVRQSVGFRFTRFAIIGVRGGGANDRVEIAFQWNC